MPRAEIGYMAAPLPAPPPRLESPAHHQRRGRPAGGSGRRARCRSALSRPNARQCGKHYSLHVPANAPVKQFWSLTVYDNESRCLIDTGTSPDRSSRDDITTNPDGSVDLSFGPAAPSGTPATNWIRTLPGQGGWFTYFRLYAPTQPYFDKT